MPLGQSFTRKWPVRPWVGPFMSATARQVLPPSVLATMWTRSFSLRARTWALKPRETRSPGTSIGTVISPVPPFHQQASSRRSTLSNVRPMVPLVSFLVKEASGVIRHAIDRVAIAGSRSAATVIVFGPLAQPGEGAGGVLDVVLDRERIEPGLPRELDLDPVRITAKDLVLQVDRPFLRLQDGRREQLGEGPAIVGRDRDGSGGRRSTGPRP